MKGRQSIAMFDNACHSNTVRRVLSVLDGMNFKEAKIVLKLAQEELERYSVISISKIIKPAEQQDNASMSTDENSHIKKGHLLANEEVIKHFIEIERWLSEIWNILLNFQSDKLYDNQSYSKYAFYCLLYLTLIQTVSILYCIWGR